MLAVCIARSCSTSQCSSQQVASLIRPTMSAVSWNREVPACHASSSDPKADSTPLALDSAACKAQIRITLGAPDYKLMFSRTASHAWSACWRFGKTESGGPSSVMSSNSGNCGHILCADLLPNAQCKTKCTHVTHTHTSFQKTLGLATAWPITTTTMHARSPEMISRS